MSHPGRSLESMLQAVSTEVFPPTPSLAAAVTEHITTEERVHRPAPRLSWAAKVAVAAAALLIAPVVFSGAAREAVADLLGVEGIGITFGDFDPSEIAGPEIARLQLGELVGVEEAAERSEIDLRGPSALDGGVLVYFDPTIGATGMVSTVGSSPVEPHRLTLITEFQAILERDFLKKVSGAGTSVQPVNVAGSDGYWISGEPHLISYLAGPGPARQERLRMAGNALIWDRGSITYRIEGAGSLGEALEIADRMGF